MKALIAAALVVTSAPVIATVASGEEQAEQPKERLICRRVNMARTQTRLGRGRVCLTAAQWRARGDMSVDDAMSGMDPMLRTNGRVVAKQSQ